MNRAEQLRINYSFLEANEVKELRTGLPEEIVQAALCKKNPPYIDSAVLVLPGLKPDQLMKLAAASNYDEVVVKSILHYHKDKLSGKQLLLLLDNMDLIQWGHCIEEIVTDSLCTPNKLLCIGETVNKSLVWKIILTDPRFTPGQLVRITNFTTDPDVWEALIEHESLSDKELLQIARAIKMTDATQDKWHGIWLRLKEHPRLSDRQKEKVDKLWDSAIQAIAS